LAVNAPELTIYGSYFAKTKELNTVTFPGTQGISCVTLNAFTTSSDDQSLQEFPNTLVCRLDATNPVGALTALVSANGGLSNSAVVATLVPGPFVHTIKETAAGRKRKKQNFQKKR